MAGKNIADDFEFMHSSEPDFVPSDEYRRTRSTVTIIEYAEQYYCFTDPVIGPVLPAVYITFPLFENALAGATRMYGRERVNIYPQLEDWNWNGNGASYVVPIKPVPICWKDAAGDTVMPREQWVQQYRGLPGTPFYSTFSDDDSYCTHASTYDSKGWEAYRYGMFYFEEAERAHTQFGLFNNEPEQQFRDCVKLAEILFRHAAGRGNARAWVALGRIYHDDTNGKDYFNSFYTASFKGQPPIIQQPPIPERARMCFERAAELGDAEGLALLGDLYIEGQVCTRDVRRAFSLYERAFERGDDTGQMHYAKAIAALRLARCLRCGVGCDVDVKRARDLYLFAHKYLGEISKTYPWWYKRERDEALEGDDFLTQLLCHPSHEERLALRNTNSAHSYTSVTRFLPALSHKSTFGTWHEYFWVSYDHDVEQFQDAVESFFSKQPDWGFYDYLSLLHANLLSTSLSQADPEDYDARTVMAMVIYIVRGEKFDPGVLLDFLEHGVVQRWLQRLQDTEQDNRTL